VKLQQEHRKNTNKKLVKPKRSSSDFHLLRTVQKFPSIIRIIFNKIYILSENIQTARCWNENEKLFLLSTKLCRTYIYPWRPSFHLWTCCRYTYALKFLVSPSNEWFTVILWLRYENTMLPTRHRYGTRQVTTDKQWNRK